MKREQKEAKVADLHETLGGAELVVVTHQSGMTVAESTNLRRRMGEADARFRVTKNRLARIALAGTQFEQLAELFTGPTAIAVSKDPVAAAKVAVEFASKNDKLVIVGGALGDKVLDKSGVETLAKLPSMDELRGRLLGIINAPATKVAGVLQAPGRAVGARGQCLCHQKRCGVGRTVPYRK